MGTDALDQQVIGNDFFQAERKALPGIPLEGPGTSWTDVSTEPATQAFIIVQMGFSVHNLNGTVDAVINTFSASVT